MHNVHRFKVGRKVWVRDHRLHGYAVVEATVVEQHYHPDRHPWYPDGEGYDLEGELWWTCYPGCRVFATREEALQARMKKTEQEFAVLAAAQRELLEAIK